MTQPGQVKKTIDEIKFIHKTNDNLWTLLKPLLIQPNKYIIKVFSIFSPS